MSGNIELLARVLSLTLNNLGQEITISWISAKNNEICVCVSLDDLAKIPGDSLVTERKDGGWEWHEKTLGGVTFLALENARL